MWEIIQLYLHQILVSLRILRDYRVPLKLVVLGGDEWHYGMVQTAMMEVQKFYRDKADIIWQVDYDHRPDAVPNTETIRAYATMKDDPTPTLYVITYLATSPEGWRGAWAGPFGWVGGAPGARLLGHELGHCLSLKHTSTGLMHPKTDGQLSSALLTPQEIEAMRQQARVYRRG